jgi:hypothetical protein
LKYWKIEEEIGNKQNENKERSKNIVRWEGGQTNKKTQ